MQAFEVGGAGIVAFENVRANCFEGETKFGCSGQFDCWGLRKKMGTVKGNWKKIAMTGILGITGEESCNGVGGRGISTSSAAALRLRGTELSPGSVTRRHCCP